LILRLVIMFEQGLGISYEGLRAVAETRSCTFRFEGLVPVIAREDIYIEIPVAELSDLFLLNDLEGMVDLVESLCARINEEKNRSLH
jgi:hypothetical protein